MLSVILTLPPPKTTERAGYDSKETFPRICHEGSPEVTTLRPVLLVEHFDSTSLPLLRDLTRRPSSNEDAVEMALNVRRLLVNPRLSLAGSR